MGARAQAGKMSRAFLLIAAALVVVAVTAVDETPEDDWQEKTDDLAQEGYGAFNMRDIKMKVSCSAQAAQKYLKTQKAKSGRRLLGKRKPLTKAKEEQKKKDAAKKAAISQQATCCALYLNCRSAAKNKAASSANRRLLGGGRRRRNNVSQTAIKIREAMKNRSLSNAIDTINKAIAKGGTDKAMYEKIKKSLQAALAETQKCVQDKGQGKCKFDATWVAPTNQGYLEFLDEDDSN